MGSLFGEALREARVRAGWSQARLGEPAYSRSYISLVESGSRVPSRDLVEHVASRLGLPVDQVASWAVDPREQGDVRAAVLQAGALLQLSVAPDPGVRASFEGLREYALGAGRWDLWWTASYVGVVMVLEDDDPARAVEDAAGLAGHWFTRQSGELRARAGAVWSVALRVAGDVAAATSVAVDAVQAARGEGGQWQVTGVGALTALVSALGVQGRFAQAQAWAPDLQTGAEGAADRAEAGNAFWALANLALAGGDPEAGLGLYDLALARVPADGHVRRWARLHRAAADFRVRAGVDLDAVPTLVDKARHGFTVSAAPSDLVELDLVEGTYACAVQDWERARTHLERVVTDLEVLGRDDQVRAHRHLGDALLALGMHREAAEHLRASMDLLQDTPPAAALMNSPSTPV